MKKFFMFLAVTAIFFTGCGDSEKSVSKNQKITLGAMIITMPIITKIKDKLIASGYDAETILFDANNAAATACKDGDLTAFVHNHKPWIDTFNKKSDSNIVMVEPYLFYYRMAIYSSRYKTLESLPQNATIVIPNDPSNIDDCLRFLNDIKMLTLGEKRESFYTILDIKENQKNIQFIQTDISTVARNITDADAVITSSIRMKQAGYDASKFLIENPATKAFPVGLSLKKENAKAPWVKIANDYLHSDEFKTWFENEYKGALALY